MVEMESGFGGKLWQTPAGQPGVAAIMGHWKL